MYTTIDLFAGAGGLSLGLEQAGFQHLLLNEIDRDAVKTLNLNRPDWNVLFQDIKTIDLSEYKWIADVITGGFPCQSFSYAGKRMGLEDTRGTLFYEMARNIKDVEPKLFLIENVKGLLTHDNGKTLETIITVFEDIGYHVFPPKILKAVEHNVPQKRERLFIVGVRNDLYKDDLFPWPIPNGEERTVGDAFFKGDLYDTDVEKSPGQRYSDKKIKVMKKVPQGGNWRNLPVKTQKEYMLTTFYASGGRTGIAKRLSFEQPSPTILCSPSQKQTERCHPTEHRPISVRESARLQTFPDSWIFTGAVSAQYRQIGNAVAVNLSYDVGMALRQYLDTIKEDK